MKVNRATKPRSGRVSRKERTCNFRKVAAHHALGVEGDLAPEKRRLLDLAITEAEALACQSGVPELVMVTLAEEKVRAARKWLARQEELKNRSAQWQFAA